MINIAEKLKGVSAGTRLYSPICGDCELVEIEDSDFYPIKAKSVNYNGENELISFDKLGRYDAGFNEGECLLFPSKENRDWENWQYCEFEKGETVLVRDHNNDPWKVAKFESIVKTINENINAYSVMQPNGLFPYLQCIKFQDPYKL